MVACPAEEFDANEPGATDVVDFDQYPDPPGPRGLPVLGVAPWFVAAPYEYLPRMARKHGDVVKLRMPGLDMILVSHPDHVEHVYHRHNDRYDHNPDSLKKAVLPGECPALPTREGEDWKKHRRAMNPRFSERALAKISDNICAALQESVDDWDRHADTGKRVDLEHELGVVIMNGLLQSMFSREFTRAEIERLVVAMRAHGKYIVAGWMTVLAVEGMPFGVGKRFPSHNDFPWPHLRKGQRNLRFILDFVESLIEERRQAPAGSDSDIIDVMLNAEFNDGTGFTPGAVRSEACGVLFAGFETTATALAWTIGQLATHPEALAKAYAEVDALGDRPVTYDDLANLTYLRACFDEGQRIQSGSINPRIANQDDVVGGYRIRKGQMVVHSLYGLHHDERFWTEPHEFRPERFLTDEINKYAFVPFSVGPRRCMGVHMAYLEGIFTLAAALQKYRFEVPHDWQPRRVIQLSTGLKDLPVTLHARDRA